MDSVFQDLRYAVRSLAKTPGFTAAAVSTLALAIGATTAIFSLLDAVILKTLPVRNPEELFVVDAGHYPFYQALRRETDVFVDILAHGATNLMDIQVANGQPEQAHVSLVSGSYFSTLGVPAATGRTFSMEDERVPGQQPIVVASYGYWQRRFGRHPGILGQVVRINNTPLTIIGVTPPTFFGEEVGAAPDLWVPLGMWAQVVPGRNLLESPGTSWLRIVGRLKPGVSVAQAQTVATQTLRRVLSDVFGPNPPEDLRRDIAGANVALTPASKGVSRLRGQFARPLELLMAVVVLVLLIACANIANLLLARASARRREIGLKLALGVSRARLIRQLLTESLMLSALAGLAGLLVAWLGTEALLRMVSTDGSRIPVAITADRRLLMFVASISIATSILFGLAPAWQSSRVDLLASLGNARQAGGGSNPLLSRLLIVGQVAVSLVLLMGAGLFLRTLANLRSVDLGFAADRLLIVDVNPAAAGYTGDAAVSINRRLINRLKSVPGVATVSMSENGVLLGRDSSTDMMRPIGAVFGPAGYPASRFDVVGPGYFSTMGIQLAKGRDIAERDNESSPRVVAINEAMALRFFANADPIGERLVWEVDGVLKDFEIIAVARDVKQRSPRDEPQLRFYVPYFQMPIVRDWQLASTRFLVRTIADPVAVLDLIKQAVPAEDPRLVIGGLSIAPDLVDRALAQERMIAKLSAWFGALAVGLACLGLYGLISYQVLQRTTEIGIRVALGAERPHVLWMMLRRSLAWIAAGIAVGVPLALALSRFAQSLLFGLDATDAATLIAAAMVMSAMGLLAGYIPARRAMRIDPLVALRYE